MWLNKEYHVPKMLLVIKHLWNSVQSGLFVAYNEHNTG